MSNMPFATYTKEMMLAADLLYKINEQKPPLPTCPSYFNGGVCAVGPTCKMGHSAYEIKISPEMRAKFKAIASEPTLPSPPKIRRKNICPSYFDGGVCMAGEGCDMDHSIYEIKITPELRAKFGEIDFPPLPPSPPPPQAPPTCELKPIKEGEKSSVITCEELEKMLSAAAKPKENIISCEELEKLLVEAALR